MKTKLNILLIIIGLVLITTQSFAIDVKVDKVRYYYNWLFCTDNPNYSEWENEGIWTEYRKNTYIAKYWQPNKSAVENMIILIPGQQGSSGSSGCSNCLTGQNSTWDNDWPYSGSKTTTINSLSLAGRIINSNLLDPNKTFLSIVFNSNFNWENLPDAKVKAEKAFTKWFLKHAEYQNVKKIFIFGSSRGGVLGLRMAKKIREYGWTNTPIFIGLVDAVPNKEQDEVESNNSETCVNPLNSDKYARYANLNDFFGGYVKPTIFHTVTGSAVIGGFAVHALCFNPSPPFYDQTWVNLEHTQIGRCVDQEGTAYNPNYMNQGIVPMYDFFIKYIK